MTTEHKTGTGTHTPTPWRLTIPLNGDTSNAAKAGVELAIQGPIHADVCWIKMYGDGEVGRANAAFIVEACNSHAALTRENAELKAKLTQVEGEALKLADKPMLVDIAAAAIWRQHMNKLDPEDQTEWNDAPPLGRCA